VPPVSSGRIQQALLAWYGDNARDLPWRRSRDPYRVWLSEVMLQQTRVETVLPYYERWLERLPTVAALAAADEETVLRLWQGLGYYRRARNLHRAARAIVEERGGRWPASAAEWRQLPGVGRYTAGAIASITRGEPAAVVDGNVKRVLARLFLIDEPVDDAATLRRLWLLAESLVPAAAPGDFNQALMELGARICRPRRPRCDLCPLRPDCRGRRAGVAESLPRRRRRRPIPHRQEVAALVVRGGRYLLGRRPPGLLGGLWEFPGGPVAEGESPPQALARALVERLGIEVDVGPRLAAVDHAYSHLKVTVALYRCRLTGGELRPAYHTAARWLRRRQLGDLPLPRVTRKLARHLAA